MFFGIGAYGVGLGFDSPSPAWSSMALGLAAALALTLVLAFIIGLFALRVRAIFYAMITLAVASSFAVLASQMSGWTGGEDGKTFDVPDLLSPANEFGEFMGRIVDGKVLTYYIVFLCTVLIFLALLRIVNSPFGRVLQAIRENEFRAEALGYRTVVYRIAANCIGALAAALAGALMALWLRYVGPRTTLGFEVMTDILLIVVIGGMGTMYGSVIGAALFILANNYLKSLMAKAAGAVAGVPILPVLWPACPYLKQPCIRTAGCSGSASCSSWPFTFSPVGSWESSGRRQPGQVLRQQGVGPAAAAQFLHGAAQFGRECFVKMMPAQVQVDFTRLQREGPAQPRTRHAQQAHRVKDGQPRSDRSVEPSFEQHADALQLVSNFVLAVFAVVQESRTVT